MPLSIPLFEIALPTLTLTLPIMTQIGMAVGLAAATVGYEFSKYLKPNLPPKSRMNIAELVKCRPVHV